MIEGVPTTVRDAVELATIAIAESGASDSARLDAELLVGHVTGRDRVALRVDSREPLSTNDWRTLDELVGRRATGEPVAYLVGTAWFYGREFHVDKRVLVPRPETELLVDAVRECTRVQRVVDACTGSGCVAVTLAAALGPGVTVHATDISRDACEVARDNAARHRVEVDVRCGDLLAPVRDLAGSIDVVVANPPYVESLEDAGLDAGVRAHEPAMALVPAHGETVDELYARLAGEAHELLGERGVLVVEHGAGQRTRIERVCRDAGFTTVQGIDDLAGIDRVVRAAR